LNVASGLAFLSVHYTTEYLESVAHAEQCDFEYEKIEMKLIKNYSNLKFELGERVWGDGRHRCSGCKTVQHIE